MAVSLNGWPVLEPGDNRLSTGTVPGTAKQITMRDVVLPLFLAVCSDINKKIIPISGGYGPDGWQVRPAHAANGLSNHSSGSAVDNRYDVMKADRQKHLTDAQHAAMHLILDKYKTSGGKRVLGWGGDWTVGTYMDEMHTEIGQAWEPGVGSPVTVADVRNVIARLGIHPNGMTAAVPPVTAPTPPANLTGLKAWQSAPGTVSVSWDVGKGATIWRVACSSGAHGYPTVNHGTIRNLRRGVWFVSATPMHGNLAGVGQLVKVAVT